MKKLLSLVTIEIAVMLFVLVFALGLMLIGQFMVPPKVSQVFKSADIMEPIHAPIKKEVFTFKEPVLPDTIKRIVLEEANTISISGVVTDTSMALASQELNTKASKLSKEEPIYLIMNTPGGSIFAGLEFIENAKGIENPIITITKFAASMGFEIVQQMGSRYILDTGTLMSHRSAGGVNGQFDGELESRLAFYKDMFTRLDAHSAKRMGISLEEYKALILNEFWSTGFRSLENKSADEVVRATCGESLSGTKVEVVNTIFGDFSVELSKCPLITGMLSATYMGNKKYDTDLENTEKAVRMSFKNPEKFLNEFIKTNKFMEIFN